MNTITFEQLVALAKSGNVSAIEKAFNYAGDWRTREWAVTALNSMITMKVNYNIQAMKKTLHSIIEVCEAEVGGGSYRTNCIRFAVNALKELQ